MSLSKELKEKYQKEKLKKQLNKGQCLDTDTDLLFNTLSPEIDRLNNKILDLQEKVVKLENKKCGCRSDSEILTQLVNK